MERLSLSASSATKTTTTDAGHRSHLGRDADCGRPNRAVVLRRRYQSLTPGVFVLLRQIVSMNEEKEQVYRAYVKGEASEAVVRDVFGDDFEEFEKRRELVSLMEETPNKEPSDDLFKTPNMNEYIEENQTADEL